MIPELGEFALWIALPIAIWGAVVSFLGAKLGQRDLVRSGERSVPVVFLLLALGVLALGVALWTDRFQIWYVYAHSGRMLDPVYKLSALWSGERGGLLVWSLVLGFASTLAVWRGRGQARGYMPWVTGSLQGTLAFLLAVVLLVVPPFQRLESMPPDGQGLHPLLQGPWPALHSLTLILGSAVLGVAFAFAVAGLVRGHLDFRWVRATRAQVGAAWVLLTLATFFALRWSYVAPSWGEVGLLSPVVMASLLPWLGATAFLHSVTVQERRGGFGAWSVGFLILGVLAGLSAPFLAPSIAGGHLVPRDPGVATALLGFLGVVGWVCLVLILWRLPAFRREGRVEAPLSREGLVLLGNLGFLGLMLAVGWEVLGPVVSGSVGNAAPAAGGAAVRAVVGVFGLGLVLLTGLAPLVPWRKGTPQRLGRNLAPPLALGLVAVLAGRVLGVAAPWVLVAVGAGAFVLAVLSTELWRGARARARIHREGLAGALPATVARDRPRWGGHLVHAGLMIVVIGVAGSFLGIEATERLTPGESVTLPSALGNDYRLTYQGLSTHQARNRWEVIALFTVVREGRGVGPVTPEVHFVISPPGTREVPGVRSGPLEDLRVGVAGLDPELGAGRQPLDEGASFRFETVPLMGWLRVGGLVIFLGILVGLWPRRREPREPVPAAPSPEEAP